MPAGSARQQQARQRAAHRRRQERPRTSLARLVGHASGEDARNGSYVGAPGHFVLQFIPQGFVQMGEGLG